MMGEILPGKIRGSAASVATAFNWACTFIVTKTFADIIGEKTMHFLWELFFFNFKNSFSQLLLEIMVLSGFLDPFVFLV